MTGLIIKDLMCLKKQLTVFIYVVIGVLAVSVMYVLSAKYGNLALAREEMLSYDNGLSELDVKNMATVAMIFFMLLPVATVGDMAVVFREDGKADFSKVAGSFPLSGGKRMLARYLSIFVLLSVGTAVDLTIAFLLQLLTDLVTFADFLGIILSAASFMGIYSALVILYCVCMGYGKEQFAQLFAILTMITGGVLIRHKSVRMFLESVIGSSGESAEFEMDWFWNILTFIKEKAYILVLAMAVVSVLSFAVSCMVSETKRGMI